MTEIRFYHLQRAALEEALPRCWKGRLERGERAVVIAGSAERVEALPSHLWTYRDRSFLPHGSAKDGRPADQPIWLTAERREPQRGEGPDPDRRRRARADVGDFPLVCELFDGNDEPPSPPPAPAGRATRTPATS